MTKKAFALAAVLAVSFVSGASALDARSVETSTPTATFDLAAYAGGVSDEEVAGDDAADDAGFAMLDADGDRVVAFRDRYGRRYFDKEIGVDCPFLLNGVQAQTGDECVTAMFDDIAHLDVPHEAGEDRMRAFAQAYKAYAEIHGKLRTFERSRFNVERVREELGQAKAMLTLVKEGLRVGMGNVVAESTEDGVSTVLSSAF